MNQVYGMKFDIQRNHEYYKLEIMLYLQGIIRLVQNILVSILP